MIARNYSMPDTCIMGDFSLPNVNWAHMSSNHRSELLEDVWYPFQPPRSSGCHPSGGHPTPVFTTFHWRYQLIHAYVLHYCATIWKFLHTSILGHLDFALFLKRDFPGGGKSTFLFAKNDDGISLALKSTNVVHQRHIYYINDYILKNKFQKQFFGHFRLEFHVISNYKQVLFNTTFSKNEFFQVFFQHFLKKNTVF